MTYARLPLVDKSLEELIDEVRLLWNALVQRGERLHAGEELSMGRRAVLEFLAKNGPATVPEIARRRRVSRQHIQALVNPLLDAALVAAAANPAHRRSVLLRLTGAGERKLERMKRREALFVRRADPPLAEVELHRAAETLRTLRSSLEA